MVSRALFFPAAALAFVAFASCGARTGLYSDDGSGGAGSGSGDAALDGDATAVACTPGHFGLTKAIPAVSFVIDRSRSMGERFGGARSRWEVLTDALAQNLPPIDATMNLGALVFPAIASGDQSCTVAGAPDLAPAPGNVGPLVALMRGTTPNGGTPTAPAIETAAGALLAFRAASSARAIVLATDGAPNCNDALDGRTCRCVSGRCGNNPDQCLDDVRTIDTISRRASQGLPTYVIGIEDGGGGDFSDVLDAMANAGGRPRTSGGHRYYAATSAAELDDALVTIRNQVGGCVFLSVSVPSAEGSITVTADGVTVPFDPTGANGWSWANRANGEIVLSGDACAGVTGDGGAALGVDVSCDPPDAAPDARADARDADARDADAD
jgi:hypothetical protein